MIERESPPRFGDGEAGNEAAVTTSTEIVAPADLPQLANQINSYHRQAESAARTAIEYALMAGIALNEAKALVPHGGWLPWLEENFEGSVRTAQAYMRVSRHYSLDDLKSADSALLTVDGALKALAEPAPRDPDPKAREIPKTDNPFRDFLNVNDALAEIRDGELYRPEYETFEEYVLECPGATPDNLKHLKWIDDPVIQVRAALMADLWDVVPYFELGADILGRIPETIKHAAIVLGGTGLSIVGDPDISYRDWQKVERILHVLALTGNDGGS